MLLFTAVVAGLIWVALVYAVVRRLRRTCAQEREQSLREQLRAAAWSDQYVETLLAKNPFSAAVLAQYATNARDRQEWPEAVRRAELFARSVPSSRNARLALVDALRGAARHDEADALLRRLHWRRPFDAEITLRWARIPQRTSDWEEGVRRFAIHRRRSPRRPEAYTEGADLLLRLGRHAEAEALIRKGMRKCPESQAMWQSAAVFEERDADPEAPVQGWALFRGRFPDAIMGYARGAAALAKAGRQDEADRLLAAAIGFFPGNAEIAGALAASAERRERQAA